MSLEVVRLHPEPDQLVYAFGGHEPQLTVDPRTVIELTTEDCYGGLVRGFEDLPSRVCTFPYLNPVTGPIAVRGAEPGDTIAVHFVDIRPARDWAVSSTFPHFGALTGTHTTAMLHAALEERVWVYDVDVPRGICRYKARNSDLEVELPLDPMHGTVGLAPAANEVIMSLTPGAHGGNMDTPEIRSGSTVYFGVSVTGGLVAMGDGHCRQGEGEVCGSGVEVAMETVVVVDLFKGGAPAWPRIESDEYLMCTGSARPLEDAYRVSQLDLVTWTGSLLGLDDLDALQLVSQTAIVPVANVVDTNYTMVAKLPKSVLSGAEAFAGTHARLRDIGRSYLQSR